MIKIINRKKNRQNVELTRGKEKTSGRWLFRLAGIFFIGTVVFALFFSDFLAVTEVDIHGLDKLPKESIRAMIDEKLTGEYGGFLKKNNLILFPSGKLEKELLEKFKRIEKIEIKKQFPGRIITIIKERKLTMLICSAGECYVINERGVAYEANNFSSEELEGEDLVTLNDLTGGQIALEVNPLEDGFREFILNLNDRIFEDTGISIKKSYETPSRMSGDLKVETEEGWKIYFNESVGLEKEMLMLRTVLEHKIEKEHQKNLEYVDLRIPGKVFYKFKEGTEQVEETEKTSALEVKKEEKKKKN